MSKEVFGWTHLSQGFTSSFLKVKIITVKGNSIVSSEKVFDHLAVS